MGNDIRWDGNMMINKLIKWCVSGIKKVWTTKPSVKDLEPTLDTPEPSSETVDPYLESLGALMAQAQDAGGVTRKQLKHLKEEYNGSGKNGKKA